MTNNENRQVPVSDATFQTALESFMQTRTDEYGANESDAVQEAYQAFHSATNALSATLTKEQLPLYSNCESAYSHLDGETVYFYYRAGFIDAMRLLMELGIDREGELVKWHRGLLPDEGKKTRKPPRNQDR